MKRAIKILKNKWNANADEMAYLPCGTTELDNLLKINEEIDEAIKILNEAIVKRRESCDCEMSGTCRYECIMHDKQHECRHKIAT